MKSRIRPSKGAPKSPTAWRVIEQERRAAELRKARDNLRKAGAVPA